MTNNTINNKNECITLIDSLGDDLSLFNSQERKDLFNARTYFINHFSEFDLTEKHGILSKKSFVKNLTPGMAQNLLNHCVEEKIIAPALIDGWFSKHFNNDTLLKKYIDLFCQKKGHEEMIDIFMDKAMHLFINSYGPDNEVDSMEILAKKIIQKIKDRPLNETLDPTQEYKKSLYAEDTIYFLHKNDYLKYFTHTPNLFLSHFEKTDAELFSQLKNASVRGIEDNQTDVSLIQHIYTKKSETDAKEMFYLYHQDILNRVVEKTNTSGENSISFTKYLQKSHHLAAIEYMDLSLLGREDSVNYLCTTITYLQKNPLVGQKLHTGLNTPDFTYDIQEMKIMHGVDTDILHQLAYNEPIRQEAKDYISKILLARNLENKLDEKVVQPKMKL